MLPARASPDFARDIFPILRRHCFECHGPKKQEGDLRLDERQPALAHESAIVPGKSAASEILRRTTLPPGDDEFMPAVGKPLTKSETELLRALDRCWSEMAGEFEQPKHWAYVAPVLPGLPAVSDAAWAKNGIDRFILNRLDEEGLTHSHEADRATLIRRVSSGPDRPAADAGGSRRLPGRYSAGRLREAGRSAARLAALRRALGPAVARPGALRRLARLRAATTCRPIWAYRDWVIHALNADMPFDQFTDRATGRRPAAERDARAEDRHRLPPQHADQHRRRHRPEEIRVDQVIDRVNTTGTVWLGLDARSVPSATTTSTTRSRRRSTTGSSPSSTTQRHRGRSQKPEGARFDSVFRTFDETA